MVTIKEVKTKKEQKDFLNFPLKMYKDNENFAPPLYIDEKKIFNKQYIYYETCEAVYFNAYRDGKMVGRISGILQKASNEKWKQNRIRFTRFDSIDDQEVADALFKAVEDWGRSIGMNEICGPLGFSDFEREGLLIEGFEWSSTFEEQYNAPYYQKLIENCGYVKEVDWLENRLYAPKEKNTRIKELSNKMLERYNLHFGKCKNINQFLDRYSDQFFDIVDKTYSHLYGTIPFTDSQKKDMIKNFKLILDIDYVTVIVDENDRVVCFGLIFPAIGKSLQKSSGHLTLPCLIKVLKQMKKPDAIDLGLVGVLPEYAMRGVSSALIAVILDFLQERGCEYAETNLTLESNVQIRNQWKSFECVQHKRRRSFVKSLN